MIINTTYLKFLAICAFLLVVTTLIIHTDLLEPKISTYEDSIALRNNSIYILGRWLIIGHCLLVLFTMWGIKLLQPKEHVTRLKLGFLFYTVFAFTEIFRQFLVLFYLNGLKSLYANSATREYQGHIMTQIEGFNYMAYALFALFIFAFAIANILYGLSLVKGKKWDRILGILLLVWGTLGLVSLGNEFWKVSWLEQLVSRFRFIYQPMVRFVIGFWFVTKLWGVQKTVDYNSNKESKLKSIV